MISVLIVDDERIIREGLKRLIKTSARITLLSAKPPTEPGAEAYAATASGSCHCGYSHARPEWN